MKVKMSALKAIVAETYYKRYYFGKSSGISVDDGCNVGRGDGEGVSNDIDSGKGRDWGREVADGDGGAMCLFVLMVTMMVVIVVVLVVW